jgi:hypothetical protein
MATLLTRTHLQGEDAAAQPAVGDASSVRQQRRACIGMCIVLRLKRFLLRAYHIKEAMLLGYNPDGKRCAAHARVACMTCMSRSGIAQGATAYRQEGTVDRDKGVALVIPDDLGAAERPADMPAQYEVFEQLMSDDTDDFTADHAAAVTPGARKRKSRSRVPKADSDPHAARTCADVQPGGAITARPRATSAMMCSTTVWAHQEVPEGQETQKPGCGIQRRRACRVMVTWMPGQPLHCLHCPRLDCLHCPSLWAAWDVI